MLRAVTYVGVAFAGLCIVGCLAWLLAQGNRTDPNLIDLDDDWDDQ